MIDPARIPPRAALPAADSQIAAHCAVRAHEAVSAAAQGCRASLAAHAPGSHTQRVLSLLAFDQVPPFLCLRTRAPCGGVRALGGVPFPGGITSSLLASASMLLGQAR